MGGGLEGGGADPLTAGKQWGILWRIKPSCRPAYEWLSVEAAQGQVWHNDDTRMVVREGAPAEQNEDADPTASERTGQFTSGIVSILGDHKIALYFTGNKHAGENLAKVLQHRADADV